MLIICPHCSQKMKGPSSNAGTTARCPKCGKSFVVGRPRPKPAAPRSHPSEEVIEGTPVNMGTWQGGSQNADDGLVNASPSRRDKSASVLTGMAAPPPVPANTQRGKHDWYVIVDESQLTGPYTGEQIIMAIREGKLTAETNLQRGRTRITVAKLTEQLRKKMVPGY